MFLFMMTSSWHVHHLFMILFTMTNLWHVHDICFFTVTCSWHVHDLFMILFLMTCSWLVWFIMWWHHSVIGYKLHPALGPASETLSGVSRRTPAWTTHASRASLTTTQIWRPACCHSSRQSSVQVATTHVPLVTTQGVIWPLSLLRSMAVDNRNVRILVWCPWGCHRSVAFVCQGLMLVMSSLGISWHLLLIDMMAQYVLTWHGHESACILAIFQPLCAEVPSTRALCKGLRLHLRCIFRAWLTTSAKSATSESWSDLFLGCLLVMDCVTWHDWVYWNYMAQYCHY